MTRPLFFQCRSGIECLRGGLVLILAASLCAAGTPVRSAPAGAEKPRLLVLTDFFRDPDDKQSMIRLLTYANEFEIEGLIATSLAHGDGSLHPEWIRALIEDEYASVYSTLRRHGRPGFEFPEPAQLAARVHGGAPVIRKWIGRNRGFEAIYHEFAARMDWCVRPFAEANHPPVVRLDGDATQRVLQRHVVAGQVARFSANGSTDTDGHALTYRWWHYREPGTFSGELKLSAPDTREVSFVAPAVAQPESIHLILEVVDSGEPRLTSYRRAVVTVAPTP